MVVVKVCDEEFVDVSQWDSELPEALCGTATHIEQHAMFARFDKCRRAESVDSWDRVASTE
jgi:hypothetical protein